MNKPSIIIQWGRKKRLEKNKKGRHQGLGLESTVQMQCVDLVGKCVHAITLAMS